MTSRFDVVTFPPGGPGKRVSTKSLMCLYLASYFSFQDGCYVVKVECEKCGEEFEEELGEAKANIIRKEEFVCLGCDSAAGQ